MLKRVLLASVLFIPTTLYASPLCIKKCEQHDGAASFSVKAQAKCMCFDGATFYNKPIELCYEQCNGMLASITVPTIDCICQDQAQYIIGGEKLERSINSGLITIP